MSKKSKIKEKACDPGKQALQYWHNLGTILAALAPLAVMLCMAAGIVWIAKEPKRLHDACLAGKDDMLQGESKDFYNSNYLDNYCMNTYGGGY